ncbi:MAG: aminomethyl-transferring glycine dehydrogenase subunit GcvPA [Candidatus Zixiibacteriota bacterium]|nr:MAG: aminomethyl-transferring glycine dehydrogenase subunit GcvPA [candidate division Zixibacteria bacterium]
MAYISNTDADRKVMLDKIGVENLEDIFSSIPRKLRLNRSLDIPALSEMELLTEIEQLANRNQSDLACFAGGGVYDHFIPAAVGAVISRPEFVTAYTPYQAEVSQGTLQVIYEFQTHICRLTGMDVANASMYDGATAAAEAVVISTGVTRRNKVVVSETVNPLYREVVQTYLSSRGVELVSVPMKDGVTDLDRLRDIVDDKTACVLLGQPNFFGLLEEADQISELTHDVGGKMIMAVDPIAQMLLRTPAKAGADIVVGEGQPLGIPLSFGGPLLGFFAARKKLIRNLPGRIVARTKDIDGKTGFVLTLQTREQHIRRQKATSNICTNQALCAATAAVYVSLMGKTGLKKVALLSAEKAQKTADEIFALEGYKPYFKGPFLREFAVRTPRPASEIISALTERGLLAGADAGRWYSSMKDCLIVALTEKRTDAEISALAKGLSELR